MLAGSTACNAKKEQIWEHGVFLLLLCFTLKCLISKTTLMWKFLNLVFWWKVPWKTFLTGMKAVEKLLLYPFLVIKILQ